MSRTMRRFLIFYLSFVLIMVALLAPLYHITLKEIERDTLGTYRQVLAGGLDRLESALDNIVISGVGLYDDPDVISLSYLKPPFDSRNAYHALQSLNAARVAKNGMPIVKESGILFNNGVVLTQNRFFTSIDEYYGGFIECERAGDAGAWKDSLRADGAYSLTPMTLITDDKPWDALVFSMPLPLNAPTSGNLFFCAIPESAIVELLTLPKLSEVGALRVYGASGAELMNTDTHAPDEYTINERNMKYGVSADMLVDPALISGSMAGYRRIAEGMAFVALVLCVLVAVYYALRNAKPVMRMVSAANAISLGAGAELPVHAPGQSELKYLNEFLGQVRSQIDNQEILIIENLFERLLRDEAHSQDTIAIARKYMADFPKIARMMLFRLMDVGDMPSADYSRMQTSLLSIVKSAMRAQSYAHFTADMLVLITPDDNASDELDARVRAVCANALKSLDVELHAAISLPFEGLSELGGVFRALRHALRYYVSERPGAPYMQSRVEEQLSERAMAGASAHKFAQLLLAGDAERALTLMDADIAQMRLAGMGEADAAQLYYAYRYALISAAAAAPEAARSNETPPAYSAEDINHNPFDDLRAAAQAFARAVAEYRREDKESFESAVLRAIDENLDNPDLCISLITERFSVSESHLQRVMHRASANTFFGYVEGKRMALAKRLLTSTDFSVRDIMQKCGYASLNSFYKAFKRFYGAPPASFRAGGESA